MYKDVRTIFIKMEPYNAAFIYIFEYSTISGDTENWIFAVSLGGKFDFLGVLAILKKLWAKKQDLRYSDFFNFRERHRVHKFNLTYRMLVGTINLEQSLFCAQLIRLYS